MYDQQMFERACLSPFLSFCPNDAIEKEMEDGFAHNVRSIIVEACQVPLLLEVQKRYPQSTTRTGITISYPFGGYTTKTKVELARYALEMGLDEVDVGIDISAVLSGDFETARRDLQAVVDAVKGKVNIVPVSWVVRLPFDVVDRLCQMYIDLGFTSLKTSAGLHFGDMKVEHVEYLYNHFGDKLEIEVAGRCRTREKAEAMHSAGAEYFHMSQWRRICGGGQDYQFDYNTKQGGYSEYKDRF